MSDFHSPSFLRVIQRPQFWIPGSAAMMTLVFLGNWVLNPQTDLPDTADNAAVVNDRARQQLTEEQSVLGSDIDNLDVLLNQLNPESDPVTLESKVTGLKTLSKSDTVLNLPNFSLNTPDSIGEGESSTIAGVENNSNATSNTLRSPQLRNFFDNSSPTTNPITNPLGGDTAQSPLTAQSARLIPLSPETESTLNRPLSAASLPLFGSPQSLGVSQNISGGVVSGSGTPVSPSLIPGSVPPSSNPSGAMYAPYSPVTSPLRPANASSLPYPSTSSSGTAGNLGLSNSSVNFPQSSTGNALIPSPYSPDPSFTDPLTPPVAGTVQPNSPLAPGQYIGNGEINTFANP